MNRQRAVFVAIMESMTKTQDLYTEAMNASGTAMEIQDKYMDSFAGKAGKLQATFQSLASTTINSDFLKGSINGLAGFVDILDKSAQKIGVLPTTIGVVITAMSLFNAKFRESQSAIVGGLISGLGKFVTSLDGLSAKLSATRSHLQQEIALAKAFSVASQQAGMSSVGFGTSLLGLNIKLALTTAGLIATKVATIALQTAMTMGLSFAITSVITLISKFVSGLGNTTKELNTAKESANSLANSLKEIEGGADLVSQYKSLREEMEKGSTTLGRVKEIQKEIAQIRSQLGNDASFNAILNDEKLTMDEQIAKLQEIQELKLKTQAIEINKELDKDSGFDKMLSDLNQTEATISSLQKVMRDMEKADPLGFADNKQYQNYNALLEENKERFISLLSQLKEYNTSIDIIQKQGVGMNRTHKEISASIEEMYKSLTQSTKALKENTKAKEENADVEMYKDDFTVYESIEQATKAYGEAIDKAKEYDAYLQKINSKAGLTPELIGELAQKYPELGAGVSDLATMQEFLNEKIRDQVREQGIAYMQMKGDDQEWFRQRVNNSNELQNMFDQMGRAFVDINGKAYTVDLKNATSFNDAKMKLWSQLGECVAEWLKQFVGSGADAFATDIKNAKSWAEARAKIISKLNEQLSTLQRNMAKLSSVVRDSGGAFGTTAGEQEYYKKLADQLKGTQERLDSINTSFDEFNGSFNNFSPTFGPGSFDSNKIKDKEKKDVKDLEDLTDRYYALNDAIEDLNNALEINKILQKQAVGEEKIRLMQQEIELYKKQQQAVANLTNEQKKHASELKNYLSSQGVTFDGAGNIGNYNQFIASKTAWANSLSGEAKESAIAYVKNLESALKSYTELTNKSIPQNEQKWKELANTIKSVQDEIQAIRDKEAEELRKAYEDQLNTVKSKEKEMYDMIKYHAEKKYEEKRKAIEKELELEKKRLEGIKKSLQEEQDLYNKTNKEEDYNANLNAERKKLAEIQAEIDRLQNANDSRSKAMLDKLMKDYEAQQKVINDMIKDKQREEINNRFEEEKELVDKEMESTEEKFNSILDKIQKDLEDFLDPKNINDMIQNGIVNGFVTIGDEVLNVQDAMKEMFKDTTIGMTNTITNISDWLTSLKQVQDAYKNIGNVIAGAGIDTSGISGKSTNVNITTGGITIQGNADGATVDAMNSAMQSWAKEIYANINNALGK